MLEICANRLLPEALKTCLKSNKLPNLVTLFTCFLLVKCCRAAASVTIQQQKKKTKKCLQFYLLKVAIIFHRKMDTGRNEFAKKREREK